MPVINEIIQDVSPIWNAVRSVLQKNNILESVTVIPRVKSTKLNIQMAIDSTTYYMRGWDLTAKRYVYWTSFNAPNINPTFTLPSLVGGLANVQILGDNGSQVIQGPSGISNNQPQSQPQDILYDGGTY
jgi:hypothetical protein